MVPMLLHVDIMVGMQGFMILCSVMYTTGEFCFQNMQLNANFTSNPLISRTLQCLSTFLNEAANKMSFLT